MVPIIQTETPQFYFKMDTEIVINSTIHTSEAHDSTSDVGRNFMEMDYDLVKYCLILIMYI